MTENLPIWWHDNSRGEAEGHCEFDRFFTYHAGPNNTGLQLVLSSMPLVTGIHVHSGLALLMNAIKDGETDVEKLWALWKEKSEEIAKAYEKEVKAGFKSKGPTPIDNKRRTAEQICLLKGLVYGWLRVAAKDFIANWEVLYVEEEFTIDIPWRHSKWLTLRRGVKPDVVLQAKRNIPMPNAPAVPKGAVVILDWKTMASYNEDSLQDWADSPQQMVCCHVVEQALGEEVYGWLIYGLIKGQDKGAYNKKTQTYDGPKRTESILCYAWYKPPVAGIEEADFQPKGKWKVVDIKGDVHTESLGKAYPDKVPVWEHMDPGEWVKLIRLEWLAECYVEAGVFEAQTFTNKTKVQQVLRGLAAHEAAWVDKLNYVTEVEGGRPFATFWAAADYQEELDRIFKRSYECYRFGGDRCSVYDVCSKVHGWKELAKYKEREPHYQGEIDTWKETE